MQLYVFTLGGLILSLIFHFKGIQNEQWYLLFTAALLAIGLYSSTYGISITEARQSLRLILTAVTVGVFLKAFIIGSVMTLILKNPFGYILGVMVAQIDPLATAALLRGSRLSRKAKTILGAWASFDDPATVLMALYVPVLVAAFAGTAWKPMGGTMQEAGVAGYLFETGMNVLFAGGALTVWLVVKRYAKAANYIIIVVAAVAMYTLLAASLFVAVHYFWMLGIALIGLFMRPPIEKLIDHAVQWAVCMAAILLGILLINGVTIWAGLALGGAAYGAQILVGYLLTPKLPSRDRMHIAFAQQNGITAIILALLFETYYPGTIAIVAPAILVINTLHAIVNRLLDLPWNKGAGKSVIMPQLRKLKTHMQKVG